MNDILKQRVVGAIILLALGIAFWPIIFVKPDAGVEVDEPPADARLTESSSAAGAVLRESEEPSAAPVVVAGDASQGALEPAVSSSPGVNPDQANQTTVVAQETHPAVSQVTPQVVDARADAPERPALDSTSAADEWTLRVATVSSAEKAETLRAQLSAMKHKVYVTTVQSGGKSLYRVSIGPTRKRVELEKLQAGINARFNVASMIVRQTR